MRQVKKGSTSVSEYFFIGDASQTDGRGLTGLVFNSAGLVAYYARERGAATAITLATLAAATTAWASGGFKEVDATNMPGIYRLDVPDAAYASGANLITVELKGASNMVMTPLAVQLTDQTTFDTNITHINGSATAAAQQALAANAIFTGVVDTGTFSATTTDFETGTWAPVTPAAVNDHFNGRVIIFTSGTLNGQPASISDDTYTGNNKHKLTVPALTSIPANGVTFVVL
jgi:hypothetical protein